jgi:hypothetical protein
MHAAAYPSLNPLARGDPPTPLTPTHLPCRYIKLPTTDPHHFVFYDDKVAESTHGDPVPGPSNAAIRGDRLVLFHYAIKSEEDFKRKMKKGGWRVACGRRVVGGRRVEVFFFLGRGGFEALLRTAASARPSALTVTGLVPGAEGCTACVRMTVQAARWGTTRTWSSSGTLMQQPRRRAGGAGGCARSSCGRVCCMLSTCSWEVSTVSGVSREQ